MLFFPLKSFVQKKTVIPENIEKYLKPKESIYTNKRTVIPQKTTRNPVAEDVFAEAKTRSADIKKSVAKRALNTGMIQRISEPILGCKKCGMR